MPRALFVVHFSRARASRSASFSSEIARASAAACPRPIPLSASRLVMRSSITWPTEPSSFADGLGFPHQRFQHDVGFALLVAEVPADDLLRRLELAIDPAVALFQPGGIPRQIEMNEVGAIGLKVDALAGGIGADQDTQRLDVRVRVEGPFDLFPSIRSRRSREHPDAVVGAIRLGKSLAQPPFQPAPGILVFREDDEAPAVPVRPASKFALIQSTSQCTRASGRVGVPLRQSQHLVDGGQFRAQVAFRRIGGAESRGGLGRRIIVRVYGPLGAFILQTEFGAVLARRSLHERLRRRRNPAGFLAVEHALQGGAMDFQGPGERGDG